MLGVSSDMAFGFLGIWAHNGVGEQRSKHKSHSRAAQL